MIMMKIFVGILKIIFKINDIISITEEEIDYEIDPRRPRRAISTYSKIDVQPQDFEQWCVTDIVTTIPNVKNYRNLEKSEKMSTHI